MSLIQSGNIHSGYTEYVKDTYGYVDADVANTGFKVESVGRLGIYSTGDDLNINPQASTGDINLGTSALTGAVNIATSGTRVVTVGGAASTIFLPAPYLLIDATPQIDTMSAPVTLSNATENITITQLLEPNATFVSAIDCAFTLPTAANIVGGLSDPAIGNSIPFTIIQHTANTTTVTANTNVTLASGNSMTVANGATGTSGKFLAYITAVAVPAVTVYRIA